MKLQKELRRLKDAATCSSRGINNQHQSVLVGNDDRAFSCAERRLRARSPAFSPRIVLYAIRQSFQLERQATAWTHGEHTPAIEMHSSFIAAVNWT